MVEGVVELHYKGSIREFRGQAGMMFAQFEGTAKASILAIKQNTPVQDAYIIINKVKDEEIEFFVIYFDKKTKYSIHKGETLTHKYEGNAFGYEMAFDIKE